MDDQPDLQIQLLGGFRLQYLQQLITNLPGAKAQALLAYLLLHLESPQSRQFVAYCFWPDSSDAQARNNLRQTLYHLRQRLPEIYGFIQASRKTLQWNLKASFSLDTLEFERSLNLAELAEQQGNTPAQKGYLQQAMDIYDGDLLPECYEDWIIPEREQFHQKAIGALESLIALLEVDQDYDAAIGYGQRLLSPALPLLNP